MKEEFVKKAGKDGITIECISARLLKARISIESNYVTFVVANAPTEEAPEGKEAKNKAALNNTVSSMPAREYLFVLTDVNARTGRRGEGGGEADMRRAQQKPQPTAGFRRRRRAHSSEHVF